MGHQERVNLQNLDTLPSNLGGAAGASVDLTSIEGSLARIIQRLTFVSDVQAAVTITATAADLSLPSVVVSGVPTGATIKRVFAFLIFGSVVDTSGSANDIDASVETPAVQVKESAAGSYLDAIDLVDTMLTIGASATLGGGVWIGNTDVKSEVDDNDTYAFQLDQIEATGANLVLHDVQTGLVVEYSI